MGRSLLQKKEKSLDLNEFKHMLLNSHQRDELSELGEGTSFLIFKDEDYLGVLTKSELQHLCTVHPEIYNFEISISESEREKLGLLTDHPAFQRRGLSLAEMNEEQNQSAKEFFLMKQGKLLGPLMPEEIITLLEEQRLLYTESISIDAGASWKKIHEYPQFNRRLRKSENLPSPPPSKTMKKAQLETYQSIHRGQEDRQCTHAMAGLVYVGQVENGQKNDGQYSSSYAQPNGAQGRQDIRSHLALQKDKLKKRFYTWALPLSLVASLAFVLITTKIMHEVEIQEKKSAYTSKKILQKQAIDTTDEVFAKNPSQLHDEQVPSALGERTKGHDSSEGAMVEVEDGQERLPSSTKLKPKKKGDETASLFMDESRASALTPGPQSGRKLKLKDKSFKSTIDYAKGREGEIRQDDLRGDEDSEMLEPVEIDPVQSHLSKELIDPEENPDFEEKSPRLLRGDGQFDQED